MKWVPVGKVVSTQGIRGEIKFYYYNEVHEDFLRYASLFMIDHNTETELKPQRIRFRKNIVYIQFEGITNINEALLLVNKELFVREEDLGELDRDEYYEYQLIGLDVLDSRKKKIGSVESVLNTGAHQVLMVTGVKGFALPLVEGFITEIDIDKRSICIDERTLDL